MRVSYAIIAGGLAATLATGCDLATGAPTGAIRIAVATSGVDLDADGYNVRVDSGTAQPAALNGTLIIAGLPTGARVVRLQGLALNCRRTDNFATHSVNVIAGDTVDTDFDVNCSADVGVVRVYVTTYGGDQDPDGYVLSLDGGPDQLLDPSMGVVNFEDVRTGAHTLTLSGLAENCHVDGPNATAVTVAFGSIVGTGYVVRCNAFPGKVRVVAATTGVSMDPDGYDIIFDNADEYDEPSHIGANGELIFDVEPGNRSIELVGVASNCILSGSNPRAVSVVGKATTEVLFSISCAAPASAQLRVVTTGVDPDPNGYTVNVAGNGFAFSANLTSTGSATVTGMRAADYTVTLSGVAVNCDLNGSNPRTVTMVSGATTDVNFDVACAPVTQLAYSSYIGGGNAEIYVVNSNGISNIRITTSIGSDVEPSWSPDGSKIAFQSERDGNLEIYVMNANGTGQVRLTNNVRQDSDPAWSPDGAKIAFTSDRDDGQVAIYVMNADGSNVVRLTNGSEPTWSPDGTKIAFRRVGNEESSIYVMNADGTGASRITTGGSDWQPDWSPDGSKIAFSRQVQCDYYACINNIFVVNANGSNLTRLLSDVDDIHPSWSPDGRWIAVASSYCGYYDCSYAALVAIKSDGTSRTEILSIAVGSPSWRR